MNPFIFVFLDGFGLGNPLSSNPMFSDGITVLETIAGEKLLDGTDVLRSSALFKKESMPV